jgi:hypothetical protein
MDRRRLAFAHQAIQAKYGLLAHQARSLLFSASNLRFPLDKQRDYLPLFWCIVLIKVVKSQFGKRVENGAGQRGIMVNPFLLAYQIGGWLEWPLS